MFYLVFLGIWVISFLWYLYLRQIRRQNELARFEKPFHNMLYAMSFSVPFKWFVEDDDNLTPKGKILYQQLELAGYQGKYTVRSFMTLKVLIFMITLVLAGITILILDHSAVLSKMLLDIEIQAKELTMETIAKVFMVYMAIALLPNSFLKNRVKKAVVAKSKDLPLIQMFIILMLRSNKTIADILFALSKLNTSHKEVFEKGYRMYLRNKGEGLAYLRSAFDNDRFAETFNLLEDIGEYARQECIKILEGNRKALVDHANMVKRRNDLSRLIYSQASMFVPFIALIVWGAFPVIIMGIQVFSTSVTR